jgi:GNAT superfamily N-acetyltransferase
VDLTLRRGTDRDVEAVTDLYLRARKAAVPAIPMTVHTDDEVRRWIARRVVPDTELWLAVGSGRTLVGLLVLDDEWVDQLYVDPELTGCGIGSELIELAKRQRPTGLKLWTFESNVGAQRFYERHAFRATDRTAGDNEEGAPDILYVWGGEKQSGF